MKLAVTFLFALSLFALSLAPPALADTVVAARTIRAQTVLAPGDVTVTSGEMSGAYASLDEVLGQETRVALYAGRPIRMNEIGPPAIISRNQIVTLLYRANGVTIATEGRSLGRGGSGDRLRVMNLSSRQTVTGTVLENGVVSVGPPAPLSSFYPTN